MDGGGRYLQQMTAYQADFTVARPSRGRGYRPGVPSSFGLSNIFGLSTRGRRDSVAVPLARRIPRFLGTGLTLGFFGIVTFAGLWQGGHLDAFIKDYGEPHHALARLAGLGLEKVTISGIGQMRESEVLSAAGLDGKLSLAFVDVSDVRQRLENVAMIKGASVRKLYPNELSITLSERAPHAVWQHDGELFVVAEDGTILDLMQDERFVTLPFVVGDQANTRTKEYLALLDAAGPLKGRVRAGSLVAGRRWTLKMDNGMDVRLPELGAREALARLAVVEREQKILEKDVLAIDLRMPDRIVVRLTEEAASARAEAMKKKPMRGKGVDT
jgi:cell division protein FtsQ